jgi:hypothetical protein
MTGRFDLPALLMAVEAERDRRGMIGRPWLARSAAWVKLFTTLWEGTL